MCGILCRISRQVPSNRYSELQLAPQQLIRQDLDNDLLSIEETTSKLQDISFSSNDSSISTSESPFTGTKHPTGSQIGIDENDTNRGEVMSIFRELIPRIASRGPDSCNYMVSKSADLSYTLEQFSSVLSLRQPFAKQPIFDQKYNIQFNGELYNEGCIDTNDTEYLLQKLNESDDVLLTIGNLRGEFAFVIHNIVENKVYFGRDIIGRRSLTYSFANEDLYISSVFPSLSETAHNFLDCVGGEVYCFDMSKSKLEVFKYGEHEKLALNFQINTDILENDSLIGERVIKLDEVLTKAVKLRYETVHPINEQSSSEAAKLGILFSGGLDCTLIAAKVAQLASPGTKIDLLTVGFDNPRTKKLASESPDRKLAYRSWFHLCQKYPEIIFQLVEVNVPYKEWALNKSRVMKLMYPANTEMDLSIAIAFYFASKGDGLMTVFRDGVDRRNIDFEKTDHESPDLFVRSSYGSSAKVLFSGLGADELFAGYTRHERIFNRSTINQDSELQEKYAELSKELKHDVDVLYVRNLGRDDRTISSWGKELRYPFLDESFIAFSMSEVELNLKLRLIYEGEKCIPVRKFLLRKLAEQMGLNFVKDEAKRAIQFGAKSAKMEVGQGKTKGTDVLV